MRRWILAFVVLCATGMSLSARAETPVPAEPVGQILTYDEYMDLAAQLAQKVNLFRAIWAQDPNAKIFAGTSRDFLYWVLRQFRGVYLRSDALRIRDELLARENIDVRDFVFGESDVDVLSWNVLNIDPADFNVQKVDSIRADRLDPNTTFGKNEIDQGYIPAEKIVIGREGIVHLPQFGNGAREIFEGKLTAHFSAPEVFEATHYAQLKINHPLLLGIRFIRLLAADEFNRFGSGVPRRKISELMTPETEKLIRDIVEKCLDGRELEPYLKNKQFIKWVNSPIRRTFRSYSNVTLADLLMKHFRINELPSRYSEIKYVNNYLFARSYDWGEVAKNLERFKVNEAEFFSKPEEAFEDLKGYHGAGSEDAFQGIVMQGILPSSSGTGGLGTYFVSKKNVSFAISWKSSGKERVVELTFDPNTRLVDINRGEGRRVFRAFLDSGMVQGGKDIHDQFTDAFGVDILEYIYSTRAFVVKNSEVIVALNGAYRTLWTYGRARDYAREVKSVEEFSTLVMGMKESRLSRAEKTSIYQEVPVRFSQTDVSQLFAVMDAQTSSALFDRLSDEKEVLPLLKLARKAYGPDFTQLLGQLKESAFKTEHMTAPTFLEIFKSLEENEERTLLFPLLLQRIDHPEAMELVAQMLTTLDGRHESALLGMAAAFSFGTPIPWATAHVELYIKGGIQALPPVAKLFVAMLYVLAGHNWDQAQAAMAEAYPLLNFNISGDHLLSVTSEQSKEKLDLRLLADYVQLSVLETLRAATKFLVVASRTPSKALYERIFKVWSTLGMSRAESLETLPKLQLPWVLEIPPRDQIDLMRSYLDLIATVANVEGDLPGGFAQSLEWIKAHVPESYFLAYENPKVRGNLIQLQELMDLPTVHKDELGRILKSSRNPLVQLILVQKMTAAGADMDLATRTLSDVLKSVKVIKDKKLKTQKIQLRGSKEILDGHDFLFIVSRIFSDIAAQPEISAEVADVIHQLPRLPEQFEELEINIEIEAQKALILIKQAGITKKSAISRFQKMVVDGKRSRIQRASSARAIRLFDTTGEVSKDVAAALKLSYRKRHGFLFFKGKYDATDFLTERNHENLHLFRHLGFFDDDMKEYLFTALTTPALGTLAPSQAAAVMFEMGISDPRFLPVLNRLLAKTAAKNMELYFKTLVHLFPAASVDILEAIYVGRFVPDVFHSYLRTLVAAEASGLAVVDGLRRVRLEKRLAVRKQVAIEGLYLDDWLERQVRAFKLERSVVPADPVDPIDPIGPCEAALIQHDKGPE